MRFFTVGCAVVMLAFLAGCAGEPLRIVAIQLGRSLNADGTVAAHTTTFGPDDTIYISIATAGTQDGTIAVRWKYRSTIVGERTKQVSPRESSIVEFHLQNPVEFPQGEYSAEVSLNGQSVETRRFIVKRR